MEDCIPIEVDSIKETRPRYSICTFVIKKSQYEEMIESFVLAGFKPDICEYLYIDNSERNKYDAFAGVNKFLATAKADYIILCHQDIVLHDHQIEHLDKIIEDISQIDPSWALLGNAGGFAPGKFAIRITDPNYGQNAKIGRLPQKVTSLDENFIVIRRSANIGTSNDLNGFHMYGTDLCILAGIQGYSAYVVDFHLWHKCGASQVNGGAFINSYPDFRKKSLSKYTRALSPAWIQSTCTIMYISGSRIKNFLFNRKHIYSIQKRIHRWLIKSK